jgi:hypothetical protein
MWTWMRRKPDSDAYFDPDTNSNAPKFAHTNPDCGSDSNSNSNSNNPQASVTGLKGKWFN